LFNDRHELSSWSRSSGALSRLARQTKHKKKGSVEPLASISLQRADALSNTPPIQCDEFVGHDLRPDAQTVRGAWLNDWTEKERPSDFRRHWANKDRLCFIAKFVGLHDYGGPRFAKIARDHDDNYIVASHLSSTPA
jgi:hypothetical protein